MNTTSDTKTTILAAVNLLEKLAKEKLPNNDQAEAIFLLTAILKGVNEL